MLVDIAVHPLPSLLSYLAEGEGAQELQVGDRVVVPLGRRSASGYVCKIHHDDERERSLSAEGVQIKEVRFSSPRFRCFSPELLDFYQWVAQYYAAPLSEVLETAIPAVCSPRQLKSYRLEVEASVKGKKQRAIVDFLKAQPTKSATLSEISAFLSGPHGALRTLVSRGVLTESNDVEGSPHFTYKRAPWALSSVCLTDAQKLAFEEIRAGVLAQTYSSFLLHGVTGSGKTEVYIAATKEALSKGKGVLVLVPEIALTPQLVERFRAQLDTPIAVLHSGVSKRERWNAWKALMDGDARVALGARSAIFAPIHDLGLIIVDEEHDGSFKQGEGLRYNARDLALARAKLTNSCVVLGSATPSLETYWRARSGKMELLTLSARPFEGSSLSIKLVDLNELRPWDFVSPSVSQCLHDEIAAALAHKEQVFLLYNRRGYSQCMRCEGCGFVLKCPHCSVSLTFHHSQGDLLCHYCGYHCRPPRLCSDWTTHSAESREEYSLVCKVNQGEPPSALIGMGSGTQKVFEEITELFPEAKVGRLDRDNIKNEQHFRELMRGVREREIDILVGTQMLAKGHDLPEVTVVGIIDCDVGIHMPDFRSTERTFQLLTQAAGRAGRASKSGRVVLQTRSPHNASIRKTLEKDFYGFVTNELTSRKELSYPPFSRLLRVIASSEKEDIARSYLAGVKLYLEQNHKALLTKVKLLGPTSAPIPKIKSRWRHHLLIKSSSASVLVQLAHFVRHISKPSKTLRVAIDIDPQDML